MTEIVDESEIGKVKLRQNTIIRYKCCACGNMFEKQYKNYKRSKMCRNCAMAMKRKTVDEPIILTTQEDIIKLKKYGKMQKIQFYCVECGKKYVVEKRSFNGIMKCSVCKRNETRDNFSDEYKERIIQKSKNTRFERYGNPNYVNAEQRKKTNLERYGVENYFELKDKIKECNLKKYGVPYYVNPEKIKKTMYERYGGYTWENKELRQKCDATLRERYGCRLEKIIEKGKQTKLNRYNDENYNNSQKMKQTCFQLFGVDSYSKTKEFREKTAKKYLYDGIYFDSSWELYLWIYANDNGYEIVKEPISFPYEYNGVTHYYFPDFLYDGELIEIKGGHFIKDGNLINPYNRKMDGLYKSKQNCMKTNNVKLITDISFAKDYVDEKYTQDFVKLFRIGLPFPFLNTNLQDTSDLGLIHHFHKSIYYGSVHNRVSPIQAWEDKSLIKKTALNRLKYIGKCRPSDILQGFNVTKYAPKVSVFSPKLATDIIKKYVGEDTIFDPFSGFSGRLIGAFNNAKKYIGQDINEEHIKESVELAKYINFDANLRVCDILDDTHIEFNDTCLFTCPPYDDKEKWGVETEYKTCDEWVDICLSTYTCNSYVFVVDKTEKYTKYIVDELCNKSHLGENKEIIIKLNANEL